jgi:hypothetical protein
MRHGFRRLLDAIDRALPAVREVEAARDALLKAVAPATPIHLAGLPEEEGETMTGERQ